MSIPAIIEFLIVLGIMVLVHEFGHYAAAKLLGIRVEVFSIGFGTRLFGFRHGETDYRICALPLGGYVKMSGDTPGQAATDPNDFNAHPRWHRVLVALAGPVANFILAFFLIQGLYMQHHEVQAFLSQPAVVDYVPAQSPFATTGLQPGDTIVRYDTVENPQFDDIINHSLLYLNHSIPFSYLHNGQRIDSSATLKTTKSADKFGIDEFFTFFIPRMQQAPVQISTTDGSVSPGTPADRAGLHGGDIILSVNGFTAHSVEALLAYLQDQSTHPEDLLIARGATTLHASLLPEQSSGPDGLKYRIGVKLDPPPSTVDKLGFVDAAVASAKSNYKGAGLIKDVLEGLFTRRVSVKAMAGPIGIGQQVHQAFQMQGWSPIIETMAMISLNLGIFNLLPIPILDGGMILFLLVESLLRRDVNEQVKERIYQVAFVCIVLFAAFIIFNDLTKIYSARP
jgi:regulator of sigma E protease